MRFRGTDPGTGTGTGTAQRRLGLRARGTAAGEEAPGTMAGSRITHGAHAGLSPRSGAPQVARDQAGSARCAIAGTPGAGAL